MVLFLARASGPALDLTPWEGAEGGPSSPSRRRGLAGMIAVFRVASILGREMGYASEIAWHEEQVKRYSDMLVALEQRVKGGELPARRAHAEIEAMRQRIQLSKQAIADLNRRRTDRGSH